MSACAVYLLPSSSIIPCEGFDPLWLCGYFHPDIVLCCCCWWTVGKLHACHTCTFGDIRQFCIHIIFLPSAGCRFLRMINSWQVFTATICKTLLSSICLLSSGDFSPCASGCWYALQLRASPWPDAARPSQLHSPGPNLILSHQLFPAWFSVCQPLWENVLHIMTMQKNMPGVRFGSHVL